MTQLSTAPNAPLFERLRGRPDAHRWIIGLLIAIGTIVRIPQLGHSLNEAYAFRQTQTAFPIREYAEHGINLLTTPLPLFGPNADVPMEFPLFQGIAALLVPLGIAPDMAGRILGLLSFLAVAVLLAGLLLRWHGRAVAIVAILLFEFLPFGLLWGASSLIDFFSVALALLMVVGLDRWFNRGSGWWLAVATVGGILGFLVKVTSIPSWGFLVLASAALVIRRTGWAASWRRIVVGLVASPGVGFLAAIGWTVYADSIKRADPMTEFLTSSELRGWNFGTLAQRLDPANYLTILDRIAQEVAGPALIGLILAVLAAIYQTRFEGRLRTLAWLVSAISAPLVFFNLYIVHSYYLINVYPAIVVSVAIGLVWFVRVIPGRPWQKYTVGVVALLLLFVSTVTAPQGRQDLSQFLTSQARPAVSSLLLDQTQPGDQIIFVGCDWDPTFLFYGERAGVMFRGADSGTFWESNDASDYPYLFNCRTGDLDPLNYLPAGFSVSATTSGGFYRVDAPQ